MPKPIESMELPQIDERILRFGICSRANYVSAAKALRSI